MPPLAVEEGGITYPIHDSDSGDGNAADSSADAAGAEEGGFYPELPFELGEDFLEEIRKYLVEEEGMDEKDEHGLTVAVMKMAEDLCEMSIADEDPELDDEIATGMVEGMTPYVEAQEKWEEQQAKATQGKDERTDSTESEADVPWVDEASGWDTPGMLTFHMSGTRICICWEAA